MGTSFGFAPLRLRSGQVLDLQIIALIFHIRPDRFLKTCQVFLVFIFKIHQRLNFLMDSDKVLLASK